MEDNSKIKELQDQIDELSSQLKRQAQTIQSLRAEVNSLLGNQSSTQGSIVGSSAQNSGLENFIGLRIIHLVGIVVLVIGLSIGVKYAIDRRLISEAARIVMAYAAGVVLWLLSLRLKKRYELFSAILFSGAMASLYFTTYAAFVYYGFYSFAFSFLLMIAFTAYTSFESIRYNRQEIAILGMVGAYGIPFLISANSERADLFFSYIFLINVGISFLAYKKRWRTMILLALIISWVLFILWGFFRYQPAARFTGILFLFGFYMLFVVSALMYRFSRRELLTPGDLQFVITNDAAFYLGCLLIFGSGSFNNHLASITGWVFVMMAVLSVLSILFLPSEFVLQQVMAFQAVVLLVLFIGFNWTGLAVTLLWVALSALLFVFGVYSKRSWPRLAAILLMSVTLGKLILFDSSKFTTIQKIVAYIIIGILLLILSFFYQKFRQTLFGGGENK